MKYLITWFDEEKGRRTKLAAHLGITVGAISQWGDEVPMQRLVAISTFTGIPKHLLRPELYVAETPHAGAAA